MSFSMRVAYLYAAFVDFAKIAETNFSKVSVKWFSVMDGIVGTFALIYTVVFGATVDNNILLGLGLFIIGTATSIAAWALLLLVRLSNTTTDHEASVKDFERRLTRLENIHDSDVQRLQETKKIN